MRIVTGSLKGRTIPFNGRKQGNIRVTPARLKEAVFSMLGPLQDQSFLDLCTGSGQMALEAYSRGANVIACDDNDKRCRILKDLLETWHVDENLKLINTKAQILIGQQDRQYVGIYVDPPYDATHSGRPLSIILAEQVGQKNPLDHDGMLFVQHSVRLEFPTDLDGLQAERKRNYGDTMLTTYVRAEDGG